MKNIITYTRNTLDTFDARPFCAVDSLVLSTIAYIHFPHSLQDLEGFQGMRLQELYRAEYFDEMFVNIPLFSENAKTLFFAMAASPRFRDIRIKAYTEQYDLLTEKQFSAVTFQIDSQLCYVAFRGTDATLVGWKEDFNMAFQSPIPSQEEAVRYIEKTAIYCPGKLYVGGHSKGGNLAVYASAMCRENVQSRIDRIFSHDGPGFLETTLQSAEFKIISNRIDKTLPQSSVVGMLLEAQESFHIVKSNKSGLLQHDPFTWFVENHDFIYDEKLTRDATYTDQTLTDWLHKLSEDDRERFVDSLYGVLTANNLSSLEELRSNWQTVIPATIHAASQLDGDTKKFLLHTLKELASLGIKNVTLFGKTKEKHTSEIIKEEEHPKS